MRPARRFARATAPAPDEPEPAQVMSAMDRMRDALAPDELRDLLERRSESARR
jgi:hypothetical protein